MRHDWGSAVYNTSTTSNKAHGIFSDDDLLSDAKFYDIRKIAWVNLYTQGKFLEERPDSKTEKLYRYIDNVIWRSKDHVHPVIWVKRQDLINEILRICKEEEINMRSKNIEVSI